MELINIYNDKRKKIDKIVDRYNYKKKKNEHDLSVQIWIMNDDGEIILTKRAEKMSYPNLWECTEGIVDYNETSLEAAIREVKEELGIEIYPYEIVKMKIDKDKECPKYTDIYFCKKNVLVEEINLQQEECSEIRLVNEEEYNMSYQKGEIIPYLNYFYETYRKNQDYGIIASQNKVFINKENSYIYANKFNNGFYISNGPEILDYRIEGRVLKIQTSPVKNIIFYSNIGKCEIVNNKNIKEIIKSEYILQGEEFYIMIKIVDENNKITWTQPIYINQSPYFYE